MDSISDRSPLSGCQPDIQFALVSYIPDPLGSFLDALRVRLVPGCKPRAHVTVLPPRRIEDGTPDEAVRAIRRFARDVEPFTIRLGGVDKFEKTDVLYLQLASGCSELHAMYGAMNSGACRFLEKYQYCPHITLAQNLPEEKVEEALREATAAWKAYPYDRLFVVETLSFVRNIEGDCWIDLENIPLVVPPRVPPTQTGRVGPMHPA